MRAARLLAGALTVIDSAELPTLTAAQVRVAVHACGICGSDLSLAKDAQRFVRIAEEGGYDLAVFDPARPVTPGHEFSGTIVETGGEVDDFAVGDRVAGIGIATDAATGAMTIIGYSNTYPGALGEQVVVDAAWLRKVPDGLDLEAAALAEPLHVGEIHVQQSGWDGAPAVVIGAGTVGLGAVLALSARAAESITVVEPSPRRRAAATELGAHRVVDPAETPLADVLAEHDGPVLVLECSGRPGALDELTRLVPVGSHLQVAASSFAPETFVPAIAQFRMLTVNFGSGAVDDPYGATLRRLADGLVDPASIITARLPLESVGEAFEALASPADHVKIMITPGTR